MAYLAQSSTGYYSFRLYIADLNPTSQYTEIFITCNGQTSPNLSRPSGNTTSLFWDVSGLIPDTQYFVTYTLKTSAGSTGNGNGFAYTNPLPVPAPNNPSNFRVYARYDGAIEFAWDSVTSADYYSLQVTHAATGNIVFNDYGLTSTRQLVSGLVNGVSYNALLAATNSGGTSPGVTLTNVKTLDPPSTPTNFRVYDKGAEFISVAWGASTNAAGYVLEVYHAATGTRVWQDTTITGTSAKATGLVQGVSYNLKLWAVNGTLESVATWLYDVKTGYSRPSNWSWQVIKGKGRSYSIVNNQITNLVTYGEIIDFQSRINEFRLYKNLPVISFSAKSKGQVITTSMYNQLRSAIVEMSPATQPANSNNLIDLLNGLRDSLNSVA